MGCNSSAARQQPPLDDADSFSPLCHGSLRSEANKTLLSYNLAELPSDSVDAHAGQEAKPPLAALAENGKLALAERGITNLDFLDGALDMQQPRASLLAVAEEDWLLVEPLARPAPRSKAAVSVSAACPALSCPEVRAPPRPEAPDSPFSARSAAFGDATPRTAPSSAAEADLDHYQDHMRLLDLDLKRTYASDPAVQSRRAVLREMLLRRLAEDPEVGYCQGLSFWAAPFAVACESKHEAYSRFLSLTQRMRALWLPGLPLLRDGSDLFAAAADDQPWFKHMEEHGVHTSMYLPQVWVALFSQWLPMSSLLECLPFLEVRGFEGIISLTLAVLEEVSPELMKLTCIEDILPLLSSIRQCSCTHEGSALVDAAGSWIPSVIRTAEHVALRT